MVATKTIDVAAGLVFHGGKLLIARRRPEDHLGGLWEFPGGKVETGETFESCLVRELREEIGIEVSVGPMVEEITHAYPEKTVRLRFFCCTLLGGIARAIHCAELSWVARHELSAFSFPPADARLLDTLRKRGSYWEETARGR